MAPTEPSDFKTLLKQYRVQAGLSQEALAERAGLSARLGMARATCMRKLPLRQPGLPDA